MNERDYDYLDRVLQHSEDNDVGDVWITWFLFIIFSIGVFCAVTLSFDQSLWKAEKPKFNPAYFSPSPPQKLSKDEKRKQINDMWDRRISQEKKDRENFIRTEKEYKEKNRILQNINEQRKKWYEDHPEF